VAFGFLHLTGATADTHTHTHTHTHTQKHTHKHNRAHSSAPHNTLYVSAYCYTCVLILLHMCSHYYMCPLTQDASAAYMCREMSSQSIYVTVDFKSYARGHASCPQVSNVCASAMQGPEQDHQLSSMKMMSREQSMLSPPTTTTRKTEGMPIANIGFYSWCTSDPRN
jgi:hypothetical protein